MDHDQTAERDRLEFEGGQQVYQQILNGTVPNGDVHAALDQVARDAAAKTTG